MKRYIVLVWVLILVLSLAGCNENKPNGSDPSSNAVDTSNTATDQIGDSSSNAVDTSNTATDQIGDSSSNAVDTTSPTTGEKKDTILKAWTGDFSEDKLKNAINEYQNNYSSIVLEENDKLSEISFETDFEVSGCLVTRLSRTDDKDMSVELDGYIDLWIMTDFDGKKVTVPINWWYSDDDSWVKDYPVWSYLVRVEDSDGVKHYYYFRTDYSALQDF